MYSPTGPIPRYLFLLLGIASLLLLSACGGTDLKTVGVSALESRVEQELSPTRVRWQGIPASSGGYRNSSIPQDMADEYEACVFWRDSFQSGAAWGWILVAEDKSTYILELAIDWDDGSETTLIDRW